MDTKTAPALSATPPTPNLRQATEVPATQPARRWYFLDFLRVLAILTVFLYHDATVFDYEAPLINNRHLDWGMTIFVRAVELWGMPLLFVIAAVAMFFSLKTRGNRQFLSERLKRLTIPYVLGVFLLGPPYVYFDRTSRGEITGSFWQFLPHYFDGWYGFGGNFAWSGLHLWFLLLLFLFSLIMLPLFRYLARAPEVDTLLKRFPALQGELFLVVLIGGTVIIEALVNLQPDGTGARVVGGWSVFSFLGFFLGGYLLALNPRVLVSFERHRISTLLLGLGMTLIYLVLVFGHGYSSYTIPFSVLRAANVWCWLATVFGFAKRYVRRGTPFLAEANQAVLPFYILHMPVLIFVAGVVVTWNMPVLVSFLVIALASLAIIVGLYQGIIRHVPLLRVAFGMKAK